jgi:hypothetical protein
MSSGRYFGAAVALAALVAVVATRSHDRGMAETQPAATVASSSLLPPADARSCKPRSPLQVGVAAASPTGSDLWTLSLLSADADRDVVVWMRSGPADRRTVWRGRLAQGAETQVDVRFVAPAAAGQVWVEVEPSEQPPGGGLTVRGEGMAAVPGRASAALEAETGGAAAGHLRVNPQTGEKLLEYPAQVEGGSASNPGGNR